MLCLALFSGCWFLTDSDLLTGIKIVKNGGVCRTERLLPHNVKCHLFRFFLSNGLCCGASLIFAASFTSRGQEAELFFLHSFLGFLFL